MINKESYVKNKDVSSISCKYVFAILAHQDVDLLHELVSRLHHSDVVILVHVDAKSDIDIFASRLSEFTQVYLLINRVDVIWGGLTMCKAMINCMETARKFEHYERITFLSGNDLLIKKLTDLFVYFEKNKQIDLYTCNLIKKMHFSERIDNFFFNSSLPFLNNRNKNSLYESEIKSKISPLFKDSTDLLKSTVTKFKPFDRFYKGTQWLSITDRSVDYILSWIENNDSGYSFFKYTLIPDEILFQTILKNRKEIKHINENLHFQIWNGKSGPKTFSDDDESSIGNSCKFFARKFESKRYVYINE